MFLYVVAVVWDMESRMILLSTCRLENTSKGALEMVPWLQDLADLLEDQEFSASMSVAHNFL